jgi:hypothetical protein
VHSVLIKSSAYHAWFAALRRLQRVNFDEVNNLSNCLGFAAGSEEDEEAMTQS